VAGRKAQLTELEAKVRELEREWEEGTQRQQQQQQRQQQQQFDLPSQEHQKSTLQGGGFTLSESPPARLPEHTRPRKHGIGHEPDQQVTACCMLYAVCCVLRVGHNHTCIGIYGVHTVFIAGKSPYIRSYTVCIYGFGQPYVCCMLYAAL